ncbi:hypothetical protein TSO5_15830 [Azospirillum sp. TSO5]|nr:hypothetical protein TSO5_15830 [Azospirillum sp. TSO5]
MSRFTNASLVAIRKSSNSFLASIRLKDEDLFCAASNAFSICAIARMMSASLGAAPLSMDFNLSYSTSKR